MKKKYIPLLLLSAFFPCGIAEAQDVLHVVKSSVNAESENAEFCLEFDQALAPVPPTRLANALHVEADGKPVTPQNIVASGASLCLFPLERGQPYHLTAEGLHSADNEKMTAPYSQTFTIPDRSPTLAFTASNGGVNEFGTYDHLLHLRAVNVARAQIAIYRIADPELMARIWQDRAQTSLAPSESAYLARDKGQKVWQGENIFAPTPNATVEQEIVLHDKIPDLAPGLYLVVADAGRDKKHDNKNKSAREGLNPMAVAWFTKSDYSLRALRDEDGIHVIATKTDVLGPKTDLHLIVASKDAAKTAEAQSGGEDVTLIPYPTHLDDKNILSTVVGVDPAGNVAFADIENPPPFATQPARGEIFSPLFATPDDTIDIALSLATPFKRDEPLTSSVLHLSHGDTVYSDITVPALTQDKAKLSFPSPVERGDWNLRWQITDGTVLATAPLRITTNADAPHLEVTTDRENLSGDEDWTVLVKSVSITGKPVPLVGGHANLIWQKLDPARLGWKDYLFGEPATISEAPVPVADFLTDLQGVTPVRLTLPPRPAPRGLYQALLTVKADPDTGVAAAQPLVLPLRPESTLIGIKPLAADNGQTTPSFAQNGIARFALIDLSSEGKARDISGLSYQVYEEGRSFAWYQDEGRWKYKPEPQLRPIGGGALTIKADASSVLEWPVTAGNYRLEILDQNGRILAQTPFSAGWDSAGAAAIPVLPLSLTLPKTIAPGVEAVAHVFLPEPAMLTAIIADTKIHKIVHEVRDKGDNEIRFTPSDGWQKDISLSVEAIPEAKDKQIPLRGADVTRFVKAIAQEGTPDDMLPSAAIIAPDTPSATLLRQNGRTTLTFGIENLGRESTTYRYAFTTTSDLKIDNGQSGSVTLGGRQSQSLSVTLSADQIGVKQLQLDIIGEKTSVQPALHLMRSWSIAVLPKADVMRSVSSASVDPQQLLVPTAPKGRAIPFAPNASTIAFISRKPMDGLAEILSYVFKARPFTTVELALSIDALRLWGGTLTQSGYATDFLVDARRQQQMIQLLRHQNTDGGFSALRGGAATLEDTAAALTALGPDPSELVRPAKNLAVNWLKQQLANTWFNEKEREPRAAAYAALAAADAIDAGSLHYFSDTSATKTLPAIAEANIAAAFKHIHDPYAAAFWIKKMLDENTGDKSLVLLNALAATDALSSDDVHAAMAKMTNDLRHGIRPDITEANELLRAINTDNVDAGKGRYSVGNETRNIAGVLAVPVAQAAGFRNGDTQNLSVTLVAPAEDAHILNPSLTRHIYRMNGVELIPPAKPLRGEIYLVQIKGTAPSLSETQHILLQDGGAHALRPVGCPLSAKIEAPSFIPWFTMQDVTPTQACEFGPHHLNVVVNPTGDKPDFSIFYFTRIDADSIADIPPPQLRVIK